MSGGYMGEAVVIGRRAGNLAYERGEIRIRRSLCRHDRPAR